MGQFAIWDLRVEHQGVRRLRTCILAVVFDDVVEARGVLPGNELIAPLSHLEENLQYGYQQRETVKAF